MMDTNLIESKYFQVYACLPFVELDREIPILLGPVLFWPASKSKDFLTNDLDPSFQDYIKRVNQIKARKQDGDMDLVNTWNLEAKEMTCISIAEYIPTELRKFILIDSLYLLYFACSFRNLYYGLEIPSFNTFRKIIPASSNFMSHKENWEDLYIKESSREETVCLKISDLEICKGLGKALNAIYQRNSSEQRQTETYKRLVRSIRYLVDRFFQRFVNLFDKGLHFSEEIFEPEDIIFLATSFETLFDLNDRHPAADFKHKLRPLLHLKYSRPVEIFWKWADDFYEVKKQIVHGEPILNPLFCLNPNFEISHIFLGIKLFVYAAYYHLYKLRLLPSIHVDSYTPPDFKWIHPEEVLLFFWTEAALLKKLNVIVNYAQHESMRGDQLADVHLLTSLFVSIYERYYMQEQVKGEGIVNFIPTPLIELTEGGNRLIGKIKEMEEMKSMSNFLEVIHPKFIQSLIDRLQEKK